MDVNAYNTCVYTHSTNANICMPCGGSLDPRRIPDDFLNSAKDSAPEVPLQR